MANTRQDAINKRTGATPDNVSYPNQDDLSNYEISNLSYPEDLASDPRYGHNKVVFFINVQGGSSISVTEKGKLLSNEGVSRRFSGTRTQDIKPAIGGVVVDGLKVASSTFGFDSLEYQNKVLNATQPNKRLKAAIALYMPEALTKSYNVSWGEEDGYDMMDSAANTTALVFAANYIKGDTSKGPGAGDAAFAKVGAIAARKIGDLKYAQKALGISPGNSKAELLFNQVEFGGMSFDYRFAPRTSSEAANVLRIIRLFRHHMLPEYFDSQNFLYIYPSEFEIRYYKKDKENEYLEKHITCVLTNMVINYNPNGQFTTFEDGMPTHINVTLTFKELGVPTKETSPYDKSGA